MGFIPFCCMLGCLLLLVYGFNVGSADVFHDFFVYLQSETI